jgi:hypothetical protein
MQREEESENMYALKFDSLILVHFTDKGIQDRTRYVILLGF